MIRLSGQTSYNHKEQVAKVNFETIEYNVAGIIHARAQAIKVYAIFVCMLVIIFGMVGLMSISQGNVVGLMITLATGLSVLMGCIYLYVANADNDPVPDESYLPANNFYRFLERLLGVARVLGITYSVANLVNPLRTPMDPSPMSSMTFVALNAHALSRFQESLTPSQYIALYMELRCMRLENPSLMQAQEEPAVPAPIIVPPTEMQAAMTETMKTAPQKFLYIAVPLLLFGAYSLYRYQDRKVSILLAYALIAIAGAVVCMALYVAGRAKQQSPTNTPIERVSSHVAHWAVGYDQPEGLPVVGQDPNTLDPTIQNHQMLALPIRSRHLDVLAVLFTAATGIIYGFLFWLFANIGPVTTRPEAHLSGTTLRYVLLPLVAIAFIHWTFLRFTFKQPHPIVVSLAAVTGSGLTAFVITYIAQFQDWAIATAVICSAVVTGLVCAAIHTVSNSDL